MLLWYLVKKNLRFIKKIIISFLTMFFKYGTVYLTQTLLVSNRLLIKSDLRVIKFSHLVFVIFDNK